MTCPIQTSFCKDAILLYDVVGGGGLLLIFITVYVTLLELNGSIPVRETKNNTLRNITVRFSFDLTYIV